MARIKLVVNGNPHDWLPIGQRVRVYSYLPQVWSVDANDMRCIDNLGTIVEHLYNGGVAVKFNEYQNVVDYSRNEAALMQVCY